MTTEVVPTPTTTPAVTVAATSTPTSTPTPTTPTEITSVIPNDQYYATKSSWGQPYDDMWGMKKLDADKAWSVSTGSPNVVIAVIDTGVDRSHEDLRNNMWVNPNDAPGNGVDDDGNGYIDDYRGWDMFNNDNDPSDDHGHGTLVAGVIDAEGNNGVGVAGVNWHAKIMPMKMIGSGGTGTWSAGASSLIYAADMGAHVSNNSWGTNIYSQIVEDAARYAHDKGMVIVAAAGNSGADMTNVSPAGNEQVISVGAVDINDARTFAHWSSNYGARLDVAAPGVDILSTKSSTGSCVGYPQIGSSYCSVPGTSLSAPFVSGIAGLLLSKYPTLTNEQIRQIIRASAVDIGTTGPDIYYGYGRANIANAMSLATSALPLAPNIRLPIGHSTVSGLQSFIGSAHGSNFAGYKLEAGLGSYPSTWTSLMSSTTPVTESKLADVDTSKLPSGTYTFKLTASTIDNKSYQFQTFGVNVGGSTVNPTPTPTANVSPTISPTNIPGAPQNVTAVGISSSQIQLSWNPPTGGGTIGVYNIYRNGIRIVQGNVLQYTDKNLQPDTAYSYFIRPQYVDGTVGPSSETVTARTLPAATLTPSITIVPTNTPTPTVKSPSSTPTNSPTVTPSPTSAPTPTPDTKAPSVSLTSLTEGATVSGQVTLSATALDNVDVTIVDFLVDGNVLASVAQTPYVTNWDTTILSAGSSHTVTARAHDAAGNVGTSQSVRVTVGDTTPPVVTLTSPKNDTTVSESVTIAANAADNLEVQRVEFYVNGILKSSSSSTPYQYVWNSREVDNGTVGISATAYDTAGNKQSDTIVVTVANADITPPSAPANIKAVATSYSTVDITWSPSTDNVGVEGYYIVRNGTTIAQTTSAAYTDSSVQPSTTYQYQIIALDRAGNNSSESATVSVTTPQAPDTDLPTTPGNLSALAVSTSQINLTWDIATDNIGVVGYEVYRNSIKVANVESNSYGDTGLNDSTTYTYYVRAYDATGNMSFSSSSTSATTLTPRTTGDIIGVVSGTDGGEIGGAKVVVYINGSRNTFTTNSFGLYSIFDLTPGTYTLKYSAKGYTTHDDSVVVTAGQTTRKDVTLTVQTSGGGNRPGKR